MNPIVDPDLEAYADSHSTPPPDYLVALAEETTATLDAPQMMVGNLEGRFLELLVHSAAAKRILEIGTFSGYSALSMAAGLPDGGHITTCEISERHAEVARRHIASSPYADAITVEVGPAIDTVNRLPGPFDLVFIDADKRSYVEYYEAVVPKLAPNGIIAADNTLWSGRVIDDSDSSEDTAAIRRFNDHVAADERTVCVQLTVRDGITLIRRA